MQNSLIDISIVIPVFNEEKILEKTVNEILGDLDETNMNYEILLCENGSIDKTTDLIKFLSLKFSKLKMISISAPNYGKVLKMGITEAKGEYIFCFELDLWNFDFIEKALLLLKEYDIVIASKLVSGSVDGRPLLRRLITIIYNSILKVFFGFRGTETHGLKAFRYNVIPIVKATKTDRDIFATELIIRAEKSNFKIAEIPIYLKEKRPMRISLLKRVPNSLYNLIKLYFLKS